MLGVPGYSGHRGRDLLLTDEAAITNDERHRKFARAATSVVYRAPPAALGAKATTGNTDVGSTLRPSDFKVPGKSTIDRRQPRDTKFIARSLNSTTFPDYMAQVMQLREHTEAEYEAAFKRIDTDRSGFIVLDEMRAMLREVLDEEPSDHQVRTFMGYFDSNADGRVSWAEFKRGLEQVTDNMLRQTQTAAPKTVKGAAPTWAPKTKPKVIGDGPKRSSQMTDVGTYGHDPRARAVVDGTGMAGTTKDLYAGTSKDSVHLPGYSGFISESKYARSERALTQTRGVVPRDTFNTKTNLDLTFNRRMPGFTGHLPVTDASRTMGIKKPTGQFAPTESGAADASIMQYWEARRELAKSAAAPES